MRSCEAFGGGGEQTVIYDDDRESPGGWAADIDIDGEVGHPLSVSRPTADCADGPWYADYWVVSGSLPTGVTVNGGKGWLEGIPTERGHWIVTMQVSNIECGGQPYEAFTQQLRFHITGTGKVIQ